MTGALNADPGPATGTPGRNPVPSTVAVHEPTANQAPPSAASIAPDIAAGRLAASSTMMPPSNAAAPGSTDSHRLPVVSVQAVSGEFASPKYGPTNGTTAPQAPSRIS